MRKTKQKHHKQKYHVKNTLNLVIKERPANYYRNTLALFVFLLAAVSVFAKFAVIDRLSTAAWKEREATVQVAHYEQLFKENASYEELRTEYEKYFTKVGTGVSYADCMDVLSLIEENVMSEASVKSVTFANSRISVTLVDTDLEQTAAIVRNLYASDKSEIIDTVSMSNADTTSKNSYNTAVIDIVLTSEGSEGK